MGNRTAVAVEAAWLGVMACCPQSGAAELLTIQWKTYRTLWNPVIGDVYTNRARRLAFTGNPWRIPATD
jgi:hypothetical protein